MKSLLPSSITHLVTILIVAYELLLHMLMLFLSLSLSLFLSLSLSLSYVVPMDLDVKMKAVMLAATFLIVRHCRSMTL